MRKTLVPFALLWLSGCFFLGCPILTGPEKEYRAASLSAQAKRYQEAVVTYNKVITGSPASALAADALFELALVHAHRDNPERDYARAMHVFEDFLKRYPGHRRTDEAQNWISILRQMLDLKKENEHLKINIEQLNRLDIRHEERRRTR